MVPRDHSSKAALSDAALASQVMTDAPDPAAEAELCRRFANRVRLYGLRHLKDEHRADELVQQVLVVMLEKLRACAVREPAQIASFIFGVARMKALELKRRPREDMLDPDGLSHLVDPLEFKPRPLESKRLLECMQKLNERQRSVIVLSFYQGQTSAEIGRTLGADQSHVRVLRHRAIARLRQCLDLAEEAE